MFAPRHSMHRRRACPVNTVPIIPQGVVEGLNELISAKHLEYCLAPVK